MMSRRPTRRTAFLVARAGAVLCAAMFVVSLVSAVAGGDRPVSAAGTLRGAVTLSNGTGVITTGGSGAFTMALPAGAACQGGGPAGYRWETFVASAAVDPGSLTWNIGPNPVAGSVVSSLYNVDGEQVATKFPATNPLGLISGIPQISLPNLQTTLTPGTYRIGVACTFAGATQDFWSSTLTVTANATDTPLGIAWTASASAPTTTTTTTPTTTIAPTTTTTPATTTTVKPTTTTTAATTTTTAATATTAVTTTTAVASSGGGIIPVTGTSSSIPMAVWGVLALVFGRMAVLLARPVRVAPVGRR